MPKKSGNDGKIEETPLYLQKSRKNTYKNEKSSSHFLVWNYLIPLWHLEQVSSTFGRRGVEVSLTSHYIE